MAGLCDYCDNTTRVIDTTPERNYVRRRRECKSCGVRFTTYEVRRDGMSKFVLALKVDALQEVILEIEKISGMVLDIINDAEFDQPPHKKAAQKATKSTIDTHKTQAQGISILNLRDEVGLTLKEIGIKYGLIKSEEKTQ